jgi:hypothetical protein
MWQAACASEHSEFQQDDYCVMSNAYIVPERKPLNFNINKAYEQFSVGEDFRKNAVSSHL